MQQSKKPHIPTQQKNMPDLRVVVLQQHWKISSTAQKEMKFCKDNYILKSAERRWTLKNFLWKI